jgi:hypothetical protein
MKKSSCVLLAFMALAGCSKSDWIPGDEESGVPVELRGVIRTATRGDGIIDGTVPESSLELSLFRANQNKDHVYPGVYDKAIAGVFAEDGTLVMQPLQTYLADAARSSKFIGLYPKANTDDGENYDASARTVAYTIDGSTDIMCSTFAEGTKAEAAGKLTFNHLLTQILVKVVAVYSSTTLTAQQKAEELAAIRESYGKVESVVIAGKQGAAKVTLPAPTADNANAVSIAYDNVAGNTPLTVISTYGVNTGLQISDTSTDFGYALFVPIGGTGETLSLTVNTEDYTYTTAIAEDTYAAGRICTIIIRFSVDSVTIEEDPDNGADMVVWGGTAEKPVDVD